MDRLSSCYFCGGALDASLSEYPVVPKRLRHPDEDRETVVLCSSCRRKLATIVERVVDAAEEDEDDQSALVDESGIDPQPDPMELSDASETEEDSLEADEDESTDSSERTDESGESADGSHEADDDHGTQRRRDHPGAPDDVSTEEVTESSEGESESSVEESSDEGTDHPSGDDPTLTRLEYSKVMRLLQNREFPVERREIREVAVNAYQIDPDEFDAIVDAAVDRGLIGEENGTFVSAE